MYHCNRGDRGAEVLAAMTKFTKCTACKRTLLRYTKSCPVVDPVDENDTTSATNSRGPSCRCPADLSHVFPRPHSLAHGLRCMHPCMQNHAYALHVISRLQKNIVYMMQPRGCPHLCVRSFVAAGGQVTRYALLGDQRRRSSGKTVPCR